jgi:hypothetical protein
VPVRRNSQKRKERAALARHRRRLDRAPAARALAAQAGAKDLNGTAELGAALIVMALTGPQPRIGTVLTD